MFFHKRETSVITLRINSLKISDSISGGVQVRWSRPGQTGGTPVAEIKGLTPITFGEAFPIECHFIIMKDNSWRKKEAVIELVLHTASSISVIHSWKLDLSQLYRMDIVTMDLKGSAFPLSSVILSVTLFRGLPASLPPLESTETINRQLIHSISSNPAPSTSHVVHGLGSLRRNTSKTTPTKLASIQLLPFGGAFADELNEYCQSLFNDEFEFTNDGLPSFGVNVVSLFFKQPRGTNYATPISMIAQSLTQKCNIDFESAHYAYLSSVYIFTLLRDNGLPTSSPHSDLSTLVDKCETAVIQFLLTAFGPQIESLDEATFNTFQDILNINNKDPFIGYLNKLVLYELAIQHKVPIAHAIIRRFGIDKSEFFDESIMEKNDDGSPILMPDDAKEFCLSMVREVPPPPLPI